MHRKYKIPNLVFKTVLIPSVLISKIVKNIKWKRITIFLPHLFSRKHVEMFTNASSVYRIEFIKTRNIVPVEIFKGIIFGSWKTVMFDGVDLLKNYEELDYWSYRSKIR